MSDGGVNRNSIKKFFRCRTRSGLVLVQHREKVQLLQGLPPAAHERERGTLLSDDLVEFKVSGRGQGQFKGQDLRRGLLLPARQSRRRVPHQRPAADCRAGHGARKQSQAH